VELSYTVAGEGPLLVVTSPGWGIGSTYLKQGLKRLLENFKIIFVTTRGSGRSTRPADMSQMGSAHMADDIEQLRRHLGLPMIDLFGHSNGGAIAISYAERYGEHLRKLVLSSSQLLGFDASQTIQAFLDDAATDPRYRDAVPYVGQPSPDDDAGFRQHFIKRLPLYLHDPQAHAATFVRHMGESFSAWAYRAQAVVDRLPAADQVDKLAAIQAETLILVGRHCWVCPVAISQRLHTGIRGSRLVVLERTGHFPWIEEPERFFPEITGFLRSR
jgi:pimeloyl-ACP methyl ester carboxylesterase